jgi:endonuclease/exonuclease/phosphatase (EEP) superfamily protein YafD
MACWIDCYGDSLLLVNNHLESNQLSNEEKEEYTNAIIDPHRQTIKSSSRRLLGKLSEATAYRGAQADTVCSFIDRYAGYSTIVCGDLNETPISYTYQQLDSRFASAYRQASNGPGFTYSQRSFPVRIDHLFFSSHWTCTSCRIDRTISASDHYPVIVRLCRKVR